MNDILDAVPIDKYFEMFKPGAAGEGGFIRVAMAFDEHKEEKHKPIEEVDEEPLAPTGANIGCLSACMPYPMTHTLHQNSSLILQTACTCALSSCSYPTSCVSSCVCISEDK